MEIEKKRPRTSTNAAHRRHRDARVLLTLLAIVAVLIGALGAALGWSDIGSVIGVAGLAVILIVVAMQAESMPLPPSLASLAFLSIALKLVYAWHLHTGPISSFGDSFRYLSNLDSLLSAETLNASQIMSITGTAQFFYYVVMMVGYNLFGSAFALYALNCLFASVATLACFRLFWRDFGPRVAYWATAACLLSINLALFTSNILKDSLVLLLVVSSCYVYRFRTKLWIPAFVMIVTMLLMTRIYAGVAVLAAVAVDSILHSAKGARFRSAAAVVVLAGAFALLARFTILSEHLRLGQEFLGDYSLESWMRAVPIQFLHMFFSPLPWVFAPQGGETVYSWLSVDSAVAWLLAPALFVAVVKCARDKTMAMRLTLYVTPIAIHALALGLQYEGGAVRQRLGVLPFIVFLYAIGLAFPSDHLLPAGRQSRAGSHGRTGRTATVDSQSAPTPQSTLLFRVERSTATR